MAGDDTQHVTEMLENINDRLADDVIANLSTKVENTVRELDNVLTNYVIDEDKSLEERRKQTEKAQKDRQKKAQKTGQAAANEEILAREEELGNELMGLNKQQEEQEIDEENGKIISEVDISAQRYVGISSNAKKLLEYSQKLNIPVPEELCSIILIKDNPLLKNAVEKFDPKTNAREAHVLLLAAASKLYYDALNRYAGYYAKRGLDYLSFSNATERQIRNFDIFNTPMMTRVRNIKDMTSAYAQSIRKNRAAIYDKNLSKEDGLKINVRDNVELIKGDQPTGMKEEDKKKERTPEEQEKIYEEWKKLLAEDIRGTVAVDEKDMKQEEWLIGKDEYRDRIFELMKVNPDCDGLTGLPLKKYLISMNSNLIANLRQLEDELPKTSVGSKFCYIPRLRDEFIEKIKTEKFAMLLTSDFFYRDLLSGHVDGQGGSFTKWSA